VKEKLIGVILEEGAEGFGELHLEDLTLYKDTNNQIQIINVGKSSKGKGTSDFVDLKVGVRVVDLDDHRGLRHP